MDDAFWDVGCTATFCHAAFNNNSDWYTYTKCQICLITALLQTAIFTENMYSSYLRQSHCLFVVLFQTKVTDARQEAGPTCNSGGGTFFGGPRREGYTFCQPWFRIL